MSMQIVISIIVMLLIGSPAAAAECKSELLGLTAYFYSHGDEWSIAWKADGVHKEKVAYKEGDRTNYYFSGGNKGAERLPQTLLPHDKQFNVPFDISRDGELLIAGIHERFEGLGLYLSGYRGKQLAIVDLKREKIIQTIETEYGIESLAWAPNGNYFAVLSKRDVTEQVFKGPLDWLASSVGHPIGYWTYFLTIYQPDGKSVCTEQVAKKLRDAVSFIDWNKQ
jgi:WD40 repeat protein